MPRHKALATREAPGRFSFKYLGRADETPDSASCFHDAEGQHTGSLRGAINMALYYQTEYRLGGRGRISRSYTGFPAFLAIFFDLVFGLVFELVVGVIGLALRIVSLAFQVAVLVMTKSWSTLVAVMAVALAGSLAGFLLYNWHPACIFLGDSGALLIGLLIGVIGVEGSMEGPSAISILFPILAMGLPISDTAMAIFRRWVRNLPLSAADRRHVHHLLIGLGLNPRQAALMLYCFSGFLCGAVMLGVALRNEYLTLILGISGCLVFLLVVTSRRDELTSLRGDLRERMKRKRQERQAAKLAWEAIQRVELCTTAQAAYEIVNDTAHELGCDFVQFTCDRDNLTPANPYRNSGEALAGKRGVSGSSAIFRLSSGQGRWLTVSLALPTDSSPAADIVFRYLQRLSLALADRLDWLRPGTGENALDREASELRSTPRPFLPATGGRPPYSPGLWVRAVPRLLGGNRVGQAAEVEPKGTSRVAGEPLPFPAPEAGG